MEEEYLYEGYFTDECIIYINQKMEEIKSYVLSNIRKEHIDEMDRLIAENKELREFRDRKEEIEYTMNIWFNDKQSILVTYWCKNHIPDDADKIEEKEI